MTAVILWFATAATCIAYVHHRRGVHVSSHVAALHLDHEQSIRRGVAMALAAYALLKLLLAVLESGTFR